MVYYKMMTTSSDDFTTKRWYAVQLKEGTVIIDKEGEDADCDVIYAIRMDTETVTVGDLLNHLLAMNKRDVETVLSADAFLERLFYCYLQNPMCNKEFRQKLEDIRKRADNSVETEGGAIDASGIARLWTVMELLKG